MKLFDGGELFIQVCRTHDEFIGLDELAELLDKTPTVEAIPIEWIKKFNSIKCSETVGEMLKEWGERK